MKDEESGMLIGTTWPAGISVAVNCLTDISAHEYDDEISVSFISFIAVWFNYNSRFCRAVYLMFGMSRTLVQLCCLHMRHPGLRRR